MKKIWIVFMSLAIVSVLGTAVYAATDDAGSFKQMLPFMKQMHPNFSEQQLQDMYNNCHANGNMSGMMKSGNMGNMENMMQ